MSKETPNFEHLAAPASGSPQKKKKKKSAAKQPHQATTSESVGESSGQGGASSGKLADANPVVDNPGLSDATSVQSTVPGATAQPPQEPNLGATGAAQTTETVKQQPQKMDAANTPLPKHLKYSVSLMFFGAAVMVILAIIALTSVPDQVDQRLQNVELPSGVSIEDERTNVTISTYLVSIFPFIFYLSLWIVSAVINLKERMWAKIAATVMLSFLIVMYLGEMIRFVVSSASGTAVTFFMLVDLLLVTIAAAALVFLWLPELQESKAKFQSKKRGRKPRSSRDAA